MREESTNLKDTPKTGSVRFENRLEKKRSREMYQDGLYFETSRMEAVKEKWGQKASCNTLQANTELTGQSWR